MSFDIDRFGQVCRVENSVIGYGPTTGNVSSLPPANFAKMLRSGSEHVDSLPGCEMIWFLGLVYEVDWGTLSRLAGGQWRV